MEEIENETGRNIAGVITIRWVDDFCDCYKIITRKRIGNKMLSPEQVSRNNKFMAYHLGVINPMYEDGLDPMTVENFDATHMVIDMDNGRVSEFQAKRHVSYAEVVSCRNCFTVCFRIPNLDGGKIEKPIVILKNPNSNYPIAGIPDDLEGITYRSSTKGWMYQQLFAEYFGNS